MTLRPYHLGDEVRVEAGLKHLRRALWLLKKAGAVKTVERVRMAITSAGGALRHTSRLAFAAQPSMWDDLRECVECGGFHLKLDTRACGDAMFYKSHQEFRATLRIDVRCPRCKVLPTAVISDIVGCATEIVFDDEGKASYAGETDVNWNCQRDQTDEETGGLLMYCRECYETFVAPKDFIIGDETIESDDVVEAGPDDE